MRCRPRVAVDSSPARRSSTGWSASSPARSAASRDALSSVWRPARHADRRLQHAQLEQLVAEAAEQAVEDRQQRGDPAIATP
jgi:hypothetical protein